MDIKTKARFMGEAIYLHGRNYSEMLENAYPKMVEIADRANVTKSSSLACQSNKTFHEIAEEWFSVYHVPKVKPNTAKSDHILLEKHLYPAFGDVPIIQITRDDIQRFFNSKTDCSRSTCQKLKIRIGEVFRKAYDDGIIQKNVSDFNFTYSQKKTERRALSKEHMQDILNHLNDLTLNDRVFLMIPIYAGVRRGEMFGLQWQDIDFEKKLIHITRAVTFHDNQPVVGLPKSKAGIRDIPLLSDLESFLLSYRAENNHDGFIISNDGSQPITESCFQRTWERIKKKIDLHGATEHVFRHTFATMAEPVLDVKTLQTIMGHSDISTTMNVYAHAQTERIIEAGNVISGMYG